VKLSSDNVRIDAEYQQGKSVADDERDLIQYYEFAAERGGAKDAQIAMGIRFPFIHFDFLADLVFL